jgi:hypothetical protein
MKSQRLIQIGGIINLLFVAYHLLSAWQAGLISLLSDYRAVMQVLNIHIAYVLAVFFVLSLVFANEISTTKLGRTISISIAGYWILRALNQAVFWDISSGTSWVILLVCLAVAALYLVPLIHKNAPQNLKPHG